MNIIKRYFHNKRRVKEEKDFADGYGFTSIRMLHYGIDEGFSVSSIVPQTLKFLEGMREARTDILKLKGN